MEPGYVISTMLVILCCLAGLDLWRQIAIRDEAVWEEHYSSAVKSSLDFWKFGYRLEDIELKIEEQKAKL